MGENNKYRGASRHPQIARQAQRSDDDFSPDFFGPLTALDDRRRHVDTRKIFFISMPANDDTRFDQYQLREGETR